MVFRDSHNLKMVIVPPVIFSTLKQEEESLGQFRIILLQKDFSLHPSLSYNPPLIAHWSGQTYSDNKEQENPGRGQGCHYCL